MRRAGRGRADSWIAVDDSEEGSFRKISGSAESRRNVEGQKFNGVLGELLIDRNDDKVVMKGLANEHAVERIPMMHGKSKKVTK